MKKVLFIFLFITSFSSITISQNIVHDTSYLKISNYLWYTSTLFTSIMKEQTIENRDKVLPLITSLVSCSRSEFENLKKRYPNNPKLEKFEQWISVEENNIIGIKGEEWKSKPTWQIGFYLVQLGLQDIIKKEFCK